MKRLLLSIAQGMLVMLLFLGTIIAMMLLP